ncbi:hypothetical protein EDB89DRAFT_68266 [Lactarius sanguifluus]|nr:hypothetical protein EDB89DRAFT_68266 [Lactarius sanguifluus]
MSAICANATLSSVDDLDLNIQLGGSLISLSRSSTTAPAPSALAISRRPQEPSEQSGTPGSPSETSSLTTLVTPIPSRHSIYTELEGTIPPIFDGTGGAARRWFNRVELHFFVNQQSTAAKDPLRKVGLTLCWIHGPRVDHWVNSQINWVMEQVHERIAVADPWAVFRQTFLEFFSYLSEVRRAKADLEKLKMEDGNVDEYIGTFTNLADLAQLSLDSPLTMEIFRGGLPRPHVQKCLLSANDWPNTFEEWCASARRYQKNIDTFNSPRVDKKMANVDNENDRTFWTSNRGNRPAQVSSRHRQCATDISTKQRAVTEKDKEKYLAEGRCFRCGGQGHISRNCPCRMPQAPIH